MKIAIDDEAADDIERLFAWVAKDNPGVASETIRRIRRHISRLGILGFSHMGRVGTVVGTRELVEPPYMIVYTVDTTRDEIRILSVIHTRQDR